MTKELLNNAIKIASEIGAMESFLEDALGDDFYTNEEKTEISEISYALFFNEIEERFFILKYATNVNSWHETAQQQNPNWHYITHISPLFSYEFNLEDFLNELIEEEG